MPPTAAQKARIIEVVKNDAQIRSQYIDLDTGETCAIGGLAVASNFNVRGTFTTHNRTRISATTPMMRTLHKHLNEHYGLVHLHLIAIQRINDRTVDRDERHARIIKYVEGI